MTQEIVTFANDSAVIQEFIPDEQTLPNAYNNQHTVVDNQSIVSFMQRPQFIGKYNWKKAAIAFNQIGEILNDEGKKFDFLLPDVLMTTMIKNKLDGLTSFRATAVIRIQLQTQPFQAGRLILAAVPMPTLIHPRDDFIVSHPGNLLSINHVQVDINKQTEISLRIPFISPFNSYNLIDGKYPWARVVCMVYSPLSDLLEQGVQVRVWGHFEDIELGTPTSGEIGKPDRVKVVQQSGRIGQASTKVRKDPSPAAVDKTRTQESSGTLSKIFDPVGQGARAVYSAVGDTVPFLKPVTDTFSTLSTLGGEFIHNLFGWLGFSKPQTNYAGFSTLTRPTEFFCNANGVDHSHVLALDKLNAVDEFPGLGGTSLDEMDMNYLIRIPQYINRFTYDDKSAYESPLLTTYVSPAYYQTGYLRFTHGVQGMTAKVQSLEFWENQPTILNYVCSFFMYWTGSLTYTFRFMKTSFHSGRVEISFHPFTNAVETDRVNYSYRTVIDLRENSEVSLTVPYVSATPWKKFTNLNPLISDSDGTWEKYGLGATGRLEVRALCPLVASNASVTKGIECVVEVRAGDDFKVMGPVRSGWYPFTVKPRSTKVVQQSGNFALAGTSETRTSAICGFQPPSITTSEIDSHRQDTQKYCAGEYFGNFRSLIKRFAFVEKTTLNPSKQVLSRRVQDYLKPSSLDKTVWDLHVNPKVTDPSSLLANVEQYRFQWSTSPLNAISSMYAFFRGGLRLKVYPKQKPNLFAARLVDYDDVHSQALNVDGARRVIPFNAPTAYESTEQKGFAEFQIPFYSPVMIGVPSDFSEAREWDKSASSIELSCTPIVGDGKEVIDICLAVAAADDLSFHSFLGVPPCVSIWRFNQFWQYPENPPTGATKIPWFNETNFSFIDTTQMDCDPCYPLEVFTNQARADYWQPHFPYPDPADPNHILNTWSAVDEDDIHYCITGSCGLGCPNMCTPPKGRLVPLEEAFSSYIDLR